MSPAGESLFPALAAGLADFRAQVEGEPGRAVRALGPVAGTIADLVRRVLRAVADALAWLGKALGGVGDVLRVADALRALLEVAADFLGGLAELPLGDALGKFGVDPEPFQRKEAALRAALEVGEDAVGVLPSPEELAAVRAELEPLAGSLGALLAAVERPASKP